MTDQAQPAAQPAPAVEPQQQPAFALSHAREAFENAVESVEFGEDGGIDMVIAQPAATPEEQPAAEPQPAAAEPTPAAQPDTKEVDWEDRYKNLQSAFTKATQSNKDLETRLAKLEGYADGKREGQGLENDQQGQEEVDLYDVFSDQNKAQAFIGNIVQNTLADALTDSLPKEVQEIIAEKKVDREVQAVIQENPDFYDYVPAMQEIYQKVETDLPVAEAFALAKELYEATPAEPQPQPAPAQPAPATPEAPAAQPVVAPSPQDLAARSQQLQTAVGNTNDGGFVEERVIASAKDAMMAALEDTYGNG
jgi:hypothetical protein